MTDKIVLDNDPAMKEVMNILRNRDGQRPHLPEPIFVEHILPMLTGEAEFDIDKYLQVVELPQNELVVFDREGNTFTVPPLMRATKFKDTESGLPPIGEVVQDAENKSNVSPRLGVEYLRVQLNNRIDLRDIEETISYLTRLNDIFERYGKPKIVLPADVEKAIAKIRGEAAAAEATPKNDFDNDEFEEV